MRKATGISLQPHQILRLPRKRNVMIDPSLVWNVTCNARSHRQPHQILRLPRKRNVMIDPSLVWNVIYNARSNRHHLATSPNTAPAAQKGVSWLILLAIECKYAKAPESWWRRSRTQGVKLCTWAICAHWPIGKPSTKTSPGKGCLLLCNDLSSLGHESSHGHAARPAPQTQRHPGPLSLQPICNLRMRPPYDLTLQPMCSSLAWWWWLSVGLHLG